MNRKTKQNLVVENLTMSSAYYNIIYNEKKIYFLSWDKYIINKGRKKSYLKSYYILNLNYDLYIPNIPNL